MTKERTAPQSPEDMAKAAQEAAVKAAMEQAQSMFGSIPGFQMPEGMQEQIMTQMTAGIPNMAEIQAQQEAMLKAAGIAYQRQRFSRPDRQRDIVEHAHRRAREFNVEVLQPQYGRGVLKGYRRHSVESSSR